MISEFEPDTKPKKRVRSETSPPQVSQGGASYNAGTIGGARMTSSDQPRPQAQAAATSSQDPYYGAQGSKTMKR